MATKPTTGGSTQTISQVFTQKGLWQWWTQNGGHGTNPWNGVTEKGIDYSHTLGTPIGVPVGGKVVSVVHNISSINDIVMVQDASGAVWLYQHINATVRVGQTLGVGSVVGTQNGVPTGLGQQCNYGFPNNDCFSNGSHIEVRYLPPGLYNPATNSWNLPWTNPFGLFSSLSNQTAGGTIATGGGGVTGPGQGQTTETGGGPPIVNGGVGITSLPSQYIPLLTQVHDTLVSNPGLYGVCLAIDEAEEFPGYIDLSVNSSGIAPTQTAVNIPTLLPGVTIPTGITVPVYDVVGIARSIGATITDNAMPAAIRGSLILAGALLVFSLVAKASAPAVKELAPLLMGGA